MSVMMPSQPRNIAGYSSKASNKPLSLGQQYRMRKMRKQQAKNAKYQIGHYHVPGLTLKEVLPGKKLSENGIRRYQHHIDKFVHKDTVLKAAAAFGLGGATVTGVLIAVGVIKIGALGAFLATPVGQAAAIGFAVGVAATVLAYVGYKLYKRQKARAAARIAEINDLRNEKLNGGLPALPQDVQGGYFGSVRGSGPEDVKSPAAKPSTYAERPERAQPAIVAGSAADAAASVAEATANVGRQSANAVNTNGFNATEYLTNWS